MNEPDRQHRAISRQLERLSRTTRVRFPARAMFFRPSLHWTWYPTPLPHHDLWIALEGQAFLKIDGEEHRVSRGTVFILTPGSVPRGHFDEGHPFSNFFCRFDLLNGKGRLIPAGRIRWPKGPFHIHDMPRLQETAHTIERGIRYGTPLGLRQAELGLWQILLECAISRQTVFPEGKEQDPRIEMVRQQVMDAPEQAWTVKRMARLAGLSHTQFARLFKTQTGLNPKHYWIQQRIERASVMLKETDLSLNLIAENAGYSNEYYFNRQFKKYTGQTPGAYRRGLLMKEKGNLPERGRS